MPLPRFSSLDFKLGARILARFPGLSIVGTVAIAIAVAMGTIYFQTTGKFLDPRIPLPGGGPLVQIRQWDVSASREESRLLHDFAAWRDGVKSITQLGAAVVFARNLVTDDGRIEPVQGADVTARAFQLMGTPPLLGRTLTARDELPGESPVIVIGEKLWRSRFDADPGILGRSVTLGTTRATIVGVMPAEFAFPRNERIWAPLRTDGATVPPRTGSSVIVYGRLAPNVSMDDAQAELNVIATRLSAASPRTHEHLRPRVTAYQKPLAEGEMRLVRNGMYAVNSVFLMLLAIMCANVATLVFARTATRSWEITVRSALGASRGRIISQLFIEALVLTSLATAVGLALARGVMGYSLGMFETGGMPFWIDASLTWRTIVYAGGLALFAAAIVGVLPALRVTRMNIHDALRGEAAGRAGLKFGGFWTGVIVVQVAITVAFLPLAAGGVSESNRFSQRAEGIGADRFLTATVGMDAEDHALDSATFATRQRQRVEELERRLGAEPGVERVAFADRLPVEDQFKYRIEIDTAGRAVPPELSRASTVVHVSSGFFDAFGTSVIAGRDFQPIEFEQRDGRVLIVNQSFARYVLGMPNPVGQRIRIGEGEVDLHVRDQWFEIVGMVKDFGWQLPRPQEQSAIYRPHAPTGLKLAVRVRDPLAFAPRLRTLAAEVDPTLRLTDVQPLTTVGGGEAKANWTLTAVAWLVGFIVLLLSASGIHALMAFTVARRTREIGIRVALGASKARIVGGIFSRAFVQIGVGLVIGSALAVLLGGFGEHGVALLLGADAIMLVVGLGACAVPLRRALSVDPADALRVEG